jgi:hypothetical protein
LLTENNIKERKIASQGVNYFKRRIGSTTFTVAVFSNPNAKESVVDKINRLIRNEAATWDCLDKTPEVAGL